MREIGGGKRGNAGKLKIREKGDPPTSRVGRPRKLVGEVLKQMGEDGIQPVKPRDVIDMYEHLLNLSEADIVAMVNDKDTPYFVRLVAAAMTSKGRGFEIVERIIDRAHGRPKQPTDITSGGNSFLDVIKRASGQDGTN